MIYFGDPRDKRYKMRLFDVKNDEYENENKVVKILAVENSKVIQKYNFIFFFLRKCLSTRTKMN